MVDFLLFKRQTFLGSVLAMIGYGAGAQVMVFFLPLFLQNAYGFSPLWAGVAMIPFAVPMVVAPRVTTKLATRFSGRSLLTAGLAITILGNLLFWTIAREDLSYPVFVVGMLVAGCGAGLLNGQTVKVLQGAVPAERAGMAAGLASTTRFIGILVSVAGLGAVLADVARARFVSIASAAGLDPATAEAAAKRITSGDIEGMLRTVPDGIRSQLRSAGLSAYAEGFSTACAIAAVVAAIACILTFRYVRSDETAPIKPAADAKRSCKYVDCRDPL